ncbi:hypothetical protein H6784_00110 [Candidatus Nomurabacteria bacterium]|nr:hypothetical protein [Candidatus Kaiserbacteria bacterium]MCB9813796.1 hypothetical protein [Candidatus Nomurabacteria bacterium]
MSSLENQIESLMLNNRRMTDGFSYTVPSGSSYPYQWFWDSCFHAIILSHIDTKAAMAEIQSLISHQFDNGMMAHVIFWDQQKEIFNVDWGLKKTSNIIQPPIIAYATERVYEKCGDRPFLESVFPALVNYYNFLLEERDLRKVNLIGYVNPDESGEDNSPRFDNALLLPPQHEVEDNLNKRYALFETHKKCNLDTRCTSETFWIEDVPGNVFLIWNLESLSRIATELNDRQLAKKYLSKAKQVAASMRVNMFENGYFHPLSGLKAVKTTENTWSRFAPLLTKQYTPAEAKALVKDELLNRERFWLPYGVSTVAQNGPAFSPEEPIWGQAWQHPHWRGPIWMTVHWFLYQGLKNYGYYDIANEVREKSLALVKNEGFREYYHPITGIGMGANDFTWGAMVIDMN